MMTSFGDVPDRPRFVAEFAFLIVRRQGSGTGECWGTRAEAPNEVDRDAIA